MMDEHRAVRLMARALARAGLSGAFGHCSVRMHSTPGNMLVCASKPMGTIMPREPGNIVPVDGLLPEGVAGEVRLHQHIYRRRADVHAICRFLSPNVLALAAMGYVPEVRHGFGTYFHPRIPLWPGVMLARTGEIAGGIAEALGSAPAIILGGNGAMTAAQTPERALSLAWFLEDAARVELAVLSCGMQGRTKPLASDQAAARAVWDGGVAERMWAFLTHGDPEA